MKTYGFARVHSHLLLQIVTISPLLAQTIDTGILGTVKESTGAVIAGAPVTISQAATGLSRTVATNGEGYYEVRYLRPGEYSAETHASGFRSERQTGIIIQIGQQARINFTMQVGALEER